MLSASVVDGYAAVFTASYQNFAILRVAQFSDRLVELNELVSDAGFLDIEHTHGA